LIQPERFAASVGSGPRKVISASWIEAEVRSKSGNGSIV